MVKPRIEQSVLLFLMVNYDNVTITFICTGNCSQTTDPSMHSAAGWAERDAVGG